MIELEGLRVIGGIFLIVSPVLFAGVLGGLTGMWASKRNKPIKLTEADEIKT